MAARATSSDVVIAALDTLWLGAGTHASGEVNRNYLYEECSIASGRRAQAVNVLKLWSETCLS